MTTAVVPSRPSAGGRVAALERRVIRRAFAPRVRMDLLTWADTRRWLSPEANVLAAEAGAPIRYTSALTPYHREPMRALSDRRTEMVVCMWPSQDGKTEILNNFVGWRIDVYPRPLLVLYPTEGMAETWSKDRLTPMLRDTPTLRGKVRDGRAHDSDSTIAHKKFPGGALTAVGSKSAAELSARPIADVVVDEADRCEKDVKGEGDSIRLAFRRAATARAGKRLMISSPTIKDESRIEAEYRLGTQEEWCVPCPHCNTYQYLVWGSPETPHGMKWDGPEEEPYYVCAHCRRAITEDRKGWMNARGKWLARNPAAGPRVRSFRKNALTAALTPWRRLRDEWLAVQGKPFELQQFINTVLVELWDRVQGQKLDADDLYDRLETYRAEVPAGAALLVRIVDHQDDRLETTVWGFGADEEMWLIDFDLIPGSPNLPFRHPESPWNAIAGLLRKTYRHEFGVPLVPQLTFVDSGGHATVEAYDFCRQLQAMNVFAIKGANVESAPLLSKPRMSKKKGGTIFYLVGSSTAKDSIQRRLARIRKSGPGCIHLPAAEWMDRPRVEQFANEVRAPKLVKGNVVKTVWVRKGPNEMLDMAGYALCALQRFGHRTIRQLGAMADRLRIEGQRLTEGGQIPESADGASAPSGVVSEVLW